METKARPDSSLSALEQLPAELIENILLEVVADVKPPVSGNEGDQITRSEYETATGQSIALNLLAHRLVCRTLRRHAWRAFGTVISHTIFDLRSQHSVPALIAMSACKELAPWVENLIISCSVIGKDCPFSTHLSLSKMDDNSRAELIRIRGTELAWYPAIWPAGGENGRRPDPQNVEDLTDIVAKCLKRLRNVRSMQYHYDQFHIPPRYRNLARRFKSDPKWLFFLDSSAPGVHGVSIGLYILLEAMGAARTTPVVLDLSVELYEAHNFITTARLEKFSASFNRVETLILTGAYFSHGYDPWIHVKEPRVSITKAMFPALKNLTVGQWYIDHIDRPISPLPAPSDVPGLSSLTLFRADQNDPSLLAFLRACKDTLRYINLHDMHGGTFDNILEVLQDFELERLEIREGPGSWWASGGSEAGVILRTSKALLYGAARSISLVPPQFKDAMEAEWARSTVKN
ncbi:Nn.00g053550.m01.CDS01 [Neocucurbitaria sp. VM-36]